MDYTKLTKSELIEKLEEQKHLAQAVDAKDREINQIRLKSSTKKKVRYLS